MKLGGNFKRLEILLEAPLPLMVVTILVVTFVVILSLLVAL